MHPAFHSRVHSRVLCQAAWSKRPSSLSNRAASNSRSVCLAQCMRTIRRRVIGLLLSGAAANSVITFVKYFSLTCSLASSRVFKYSPSMCWFCVSFAFGSLVAAFSGEPALDIDDDGVVTFADASRFIALDMAFFDEQRAMAWTSPSFDSNFRLATVKVPAKIESVRFWWHFFYCCFRTHSARCWLTCCFFLLFDPRRLKIGRGRAQSAQDSVRRRRRARRDF